MMEMHERIVDVTALFFFLSAVVNNWKSTDNRRG